ncbi:hypothetical protein GCM10022224_070290 [Nonomuraea antimicrobica]|uniref:Uncharacterized protein n=1 Tax=Nonomuraea antimicrobica TaxID=561173 RepID=A0ABP7CSN3_9ACTN
MRAGLGTSVSRGRSVIGGAFPGDRGGYAESVLVKIGPYAASGGVQTGAARLYREQYRPRVIESLLLVTMAKLA